MKRFPLFILTLALAALACGQESTPAPSWASSRVLASGEDHPSKLVVDGGYVYYVTGGTLASQEEETNNIKRVSLADGTIEAIVQGGNRIPAETLALDGEYLYWSDGGNILRTHKNGGDAEEVVSGVAAPSDLYVDDSSLYWIPFMGEGSPPGPIYSADKNGGEAQALTPPLNAPNGLNLDGDWLYWVNPEAVYRMPRTGGTIETIFSRANDNETISGLTLDADNLYFAQLKSGGKTALMKLPKPTDGASTATPVELADSVNWTMEFKAYDGYVYYFANASGASFAGLDLRKISAAGGEPVMLDTGDAGWVRFITLDEKHVYFTNISQVFAIGR